MARLDRLELPSGNWVEFHDTDTIKAKHLRQLIRIAGPSEDIGAAQVTDCVAYLATVLIGRWSFNYAIDADGVDDMPPLDFQTLVAALWPVVLAVLTGKEYVPPAKAEEVKQGEDVPASV